jgi:hypothetical protein
MKYKIEINLILMATELPLKCHITLCTGHLIYFTMTFSKTRNFNFFYSVHVKLRKEYQNISEI